jgi:hypothetical protein
MQKRFRDSKRRQGDPERGPKDQERGPEDSEKGVQRFRIDSQGTQKRESRIIETE